MIQAVAFFVFFALWLTAGITGIVLGIRKKDCPKAARVATIVLSILILIPALYECLVLLYVSQCTRPGNVCL